MDIKKMLAELNGIDIKGFEKQPKANDSDRITDLEDAMMILSEMLFAESEGE